MSCSSTPIDMRCRELKCFNRGQENGQRLNYDLGPSTSSSQTWDVIQRWTDDCDSHPEKCHANRGTGFMPSRILELDSEAKTYRLVLATEVPRHTRYMILSHC
ncbi:hypothetical protein B0T14DRAFT_522630 [Immersiella caudata]|uniref:Uncharacterized protein n=1 Tax=Immersiella caudata TaxID=314043 RepID=A0AA40BWG1_9PEZI|nr:hypothetical protein B0T14DRAFT_522630 [Immersiella caudata]